MIDLIVLIIGGVIISVWLGITIQFKVWESRAKRYLLNNDLKGFEAYLEDADHFKSMRIWDFIGRKNFDNSREAKDIIQKRWWVETFDSLGVFSKEKAV